MNNKVVYIHRKATNREIFYVGIGTPERPYNKSKSDRSEFWHKIVDRHGYDVEVIHTGISWEDACDIEKDLIELIGRRNLGLGTLVNLTDGGEGTQGVVWSDERKAEASANYTQEMRDASSELHSRPVIDTATGIEYSAMGVACDELGFKVSTITDQLRGRSSIQPYNTLRYLDDLNPKQKVLKYVYRKDNKILPKNVIDIATNTVYDSMKTACKDMGISYASARLQMCGARKRKEYNTLYKLCELVISPDGYETQADPKYKPKKGTKKAKRGTFTYMEKYLERQKNNPKKKELRPMKRVEKKSIELVQMHKEVDEQIARLITYMRQAS